MRLVVGFPRPVRTAAMLLLAALAPTVAGTHAADPPRGDVVEVIVGLGTCTRFLAALRAADRVGALRANSGGGTVFVPDDAAFERLPAGTLDELLRPENTARLAALMDYHRVPGRTLTVSDLRGAAGPRPLPTANQGAALVIARTGPEGTAVTVNGAGLLRADLPATNGTVHVIDRVLLPPTTSAK